MSNAIDHVCKNILYKSLGSPQVKDYYALDEINQELKEIEGSEIEPHDQHGRVMSNVMFHFDYKSFISMIQPAHRCNEDESIQDRVSTFIDLSMVG